MAESLGTVKSGTYGAADLFTEQRKYDKDKSKQFIWRERGFAKMISMLVTKFPKYEATDRQPKHFEDGYTQSEFTMTKDSFTTGEVSFQISEAEAKLIRVGDLLRVAGGTGATWVNKTGTFGAVTVTYGSRSATYTEEEVVRVTAKSAVGATDAGTVDLTVTRGIGGETVTSAPNIVSGTKLTKLLNATEDGGESPDSISQNAVVVNNVLQEFREPYEQTEIAMATDIFGENEWQRKARRARKDNARAMTRTLISGKMDMFTGSDNEDIGTTGGIEEWIPNDAEHRIDWGGAVVSSSLFNTNGQAVFAYGNEEKYLVCGRGLAGKVGNAFQDRMRFNQTLSNDIGFDVSTIGLSGGGTVHVMAEFEMEKLGKSNEGFFVDFPYLGYMYLKGLDLYINKGKGGTGLQSNSATKLKHEIRGVIGWRRTFKDTFFSMWNVG